MCLQHNIARSKTESKTRVVEIFATRNSSQITSLAHLEDSADLDKAMNLIFKTRRTLKKKIEKNLVFSTLINT